MKKETPSMLAADMVAHLRSQGFTIDLWEDPKVEAAFCDGLSVVFQMIKRVLFDDPRNEPKAPNYLDIAFSACNFYQPPNESGEFPREEMHVIFCRPGRPSPHMFRRHAEGQVKMLKAAIEDRQNTEMGAEDHIALLKKMVKMIPEPEVL